MSYINQTLGVRLLVVSRNSLGLSRDVKIKHTKGYSNFAGVASKYKSSTEYQPVADFYAGKSVFITGATGFLGKVFLEKLLYSCNKLDKVYVLVREKKGADVNKRIADILNNPLFTRLKETNPQYLKKVIPITGDITLPNLGIKPEDEDTLINKVSVVYHAAATVKFNEPLPVAMNINFEGTQKILKLSKQIKNIEAFIYVSTAFAHTQKPVLLETVYPSPAKLEDVYKFMEMSGHNMKETMKFIGEKPNTYTFTKSLTEAYITNNHGDIPTVIIRPSVVSSIKDEPVKGWVDNWFGATTVLHNNAKGWNRIMLGHPANLLDLVPVDYVSNLCIVAGSRASKEAQVFNSTTSSVNPLTMGKVIQYYREEMIKSGKHEVPFPFTMFSKSRLVVNMGTMILQMIPAHIADFWLKMTGQEPKYVKIQSQVAGYRNSVDFFTLHTFEMRAERTRELYSSLSPEDKREFPCDPTQIEWKEYVGDYLRGVLRYLKPKNTV